MLGSFQDAEDAMQDALLAAWQGLGGFEGRASVRTWLYRVTPTRRLNGRRSARRPHAARADPARRGDLARTLPGRPADGPARRRTRTGGQVRGARGDLAGL